MKKFLLLIVIVLCFVVAVGYYMYNTNKCVPLFGIRFCYWQTQSTETDKNCRTEYTAHCRNLDTIASCTSTLEWLCDCNITIGDKHYTFSSNEIKHLDYELDESEKDCQPFCNEFCDAKLEELKAQ